MVVLACTGQAVTDRSISRLVVVEEKPDLGMANQATS